MITITEALAEIKTINARLAKKREAVQQYLLRDSKMVDPLAEDGGSAEFVKRERQAIKDLEERIVKIRSAIQRENCTQKLVVGGQERYVSEWLNWRREVAPSMRAFVSNLYGGIQNARREAAKKGYRVAEAGDKDAGTEVPTLVVNLSEKALVAEVESAEEILGALDGKLSLANATMKVEV